MKTLGLIGNPVAHSKSPEIFENIFLQNSLSDWEYKLFSLEKIEDLVHLIESNLTLLGFNVTIPFKQTILPYLDAVSIEAVKVGAVNTVVINREKNDPRLFGFNTDTFGFESALNLFNLPENSEALILGTGGSSRAVQYVLHEKKIPYKLVSRNLGENKIIYSQLNHNIIQNHNLIINTTPCGMDPDIENTPPIPYEFISQDHFCFDLIYNPIKTRFMQLAEEKGAQIQNGQSMLQFQAEKAWKLFNLAQNTE